jgi:predicted lipase
MATFVYLPDTPSIKKSMLEDAPGWTLVAHHKIAGYGGIVGTDTDTILLAQNEVSLECVLGFEGTDANMEMLTSLYVTSTSFCGFASVHKGFTEEIWSITSSTQYQTDVRPKLGKCSKVTVVGHSLGGAISEVFAACINSGRTDEQVYKQMSWTKGTAEKMGEI